VPYLGTGTLAQGLLTTFALITASKWSALSTWRLGGRLRQPVAALGSFSWAHGVFGVEWSR